MVVPVVQWLAHCTDTEVLGSIPGQSEIYMENSISAARPAHSAVMSRLGLFTWLKVKAARE